MYLCVIIKLYVSHIKIIEMEREKEKDEHRTLHMSKFGGCFSSRRPKSFRDKKIRLNIEHYAADATAQISVEDGHSVLHCSAICCTEQIFLYCLGCFS